MRKSIFLCGVSGAGKTTAGKAFINKPVYVVELDQLIRTLYPVLNVGNDLRNPYRFDHWQVFLSRTDNNELVLNAFQEYIDGSNKPEIINLLLIGNHFLIPAFEQILINVLESLGFQAPLKLLLDTKWHTVYRYRKKRATLRDRQTSLKDVILQIHKYRKSLRPRGYVSVNSSELNAKIHAFFQIV